MLWRKLLMTPFLLLVMAGCVEGKQAEPEENASTFQQKGKASYYGPGFHGQTTASGETFDQNELVAAHKKLPFGTLVEVTNLENGESVTVRINDRGPYKPGRIIDLSVEAARRIDLLHDGVTTVEIAEVEE